MSKTLNLNKFAQNLTVSGELKNITFGGSYGTSGQYLTSAGPNSAPIWQTATPLPTFKVTGVVYPGSVLAADPAGGETVVLNGTGFTATPTVFVDNVIVPSVTFISSTQISFVTPVKAAGTYHIYVINPDGSTCIKVNGLSYSGTPAWTTAAGDLGSFSTSISIQLQATGDAPLVYSLTNGSTLPAGVTLSSSGLLSGTVSTDQVFNFSVTVTDAQNQTTPRSFSVTVVSAEPYFKYNTLLLSGDGVNGSNNNIFLDSSPNNFTITANGSGSVTQGSFSPFGTNWSTYFDGATECLTIPDNPALQLGSSNFTVEFWVNPLSATEGDAIYLCGNSASYAALRIDVNSYGIVEFLMSSNGTGWDVAITLNGYNHFVSGFNHVAVTRSGTSILLFINGIQRGSYTFSGSLYNGTLHQIGKFSTLYLKGYISNVRIVKGTALYTANFTPSTTPLTAVANTVLLTCQSNRFVDNSINNFTISANTVSSPSVQRYNPFAPTEVYSSTTQGGSASFNGTRKLKIPYTTTIPGDFTIEFWMYMTTAPNTYVSLFSGDSNPGLQIRFGDSGFGYKLQFCLFVNLVTTCYSVNYTQAQLVNTWKHVAWTRQNGVNRIFIDGVLQNINNGANPSTYPLTSWTDSASISFATGMWLSDDATQPFTGYMSNFRLINGSAIYTNTFTVPTSPLTAIANTSTLLNFTNAGIYDSTTISNLMTSGNAKVSTSVKKYGTGSLYFDGTSGSVIKSLGTTNNLQLGNGNFTIECWVYFNNTTGAAQIVNTATNTTNCSYALYRSGTSLYFYLSSTGTTWDIANGSTIGTVSANTWYHVALVRSGSTFTSYLNGVAGGTVTNTSANTLFSSTGVGLGNDASGTSADVLNGYIDDLRITKGYARYTANFTPPTAALPVR